MNDIQENSPTTVGADAGQTLRRLRLSFVGEVQAVGFRWTAREQARSVGATGWVRNEDDGSVSMELQGTDEQIALYFGRFNRAYAWHPIDYIIAEKEDIPVLEDEHDFTVRLSQW